MSKSLQDQLLESGIAKPKQAKKARRDKASKAKAARKQGKPADDQASLRGEIDADQAAKRERDRQLNEAQMTRRQARERDNTVGQIIGANRVAREPEAPEAVSYNYQLDGRIHQIAVSDDQRRKLASGRLAIVRHRGAPALVPGEVGQRLQAMVPERVWLVTADDEPTDPDDPYAAYPVPDDLMW